MKFREATKEDLDFVSENSVSRGIQKLCPEQIEYLFVLEHDGILGIGGFKFINATTAWTWYDLTHLAGNNMIVVYRTIKEWMESFVKEHGIKRLQAYIELDFPEAIRTAEHLGFKWESNMENFIGDKMVFMYKRTF